MVSIIIVTLNSSSCIGKCLNSIASQTFSDYEIIVIDNGSTGKMLTFAGEASLWGGNAIIILRQLPAIREDILRKIINWRRT